MILPSLATSVFFSYLSIQPVIISSLCFPSVFLSLFFVVSTRSGVFASLFLLLVFLFFVTGSHASLLPFSLSPCISFSYSSFSLIIPLLSSYIPILCLLPLCSNFLHLNSPPHSPSLLHTSSDTTSQYVNSRGFVAGAIQLKVTFDKRMVSNFDPRPERDKLIKSTPVFKLLLFFFTLGERKA